MLHHHVIRIPRPSHVLLAGVDISVTVDHIDGKVIRNYNATLYPNYQCARGSIIELNFEIEACTRLREVSSCAESKVSRDGVRSTCSTCCCVLDISPVANGFEICNNARASRSQIKQDGKVSIRLPYLVISWVYRYSTIT